MSTVYSRTWASGKVSWYTKVPDAPGRPWKPLLLKGVKNEPQARKLANEIERHRERASQGLPPDLALVSGTLADLCWAVFDAHFSAKGSAQPDASRFKTHVGARPGTGGAPTELGRTPLRSVTGPLLADYFDRLSKTLTVRGKPYSGGAINRFRAQLATVFEFAAERGRWAGPNPVHATSARAVEATNHDILEAHEVGPVLAACDPYWRGCLAVGILAALRKGEIFALEKRDVDLPRRILLVRRSHGRQTTKGGHKDAVPIHEDLVPFLEEALESPGPLLFPDARGKRRPEHSNLPRILQSALVRAGIIAHWELKCRRKGCGYLEVSEGASEPSPRDCPACAFRLWAVPKARAIGWHEGTRHTAASHLLMSGASVASVQAILRHKDPRLTIQTYGHLTSGFLGDEVNRLSLGLAAPGEPLPIVRRLAAVTAPTASEATEQAPARSRAARAASGSAAPARAPTPRSRAHNPAPAAGAPVVRGGKRTAPDGGGEIEIEHESGLGGEWRRGGSNPGPMHCEGNRVQFPVAAPVSTASQGVEITEMEPVSIPTGSHPVAPAVARHGAPLVRREPSTHHESEHAYAGGLGRHAAFSTERAPEDLLTLQQVADRLAVGRTWVRRRVESGDFRAVRQHPTAPALIPASDVEAYLQRFPGLVPTEAPAPPAEPVAPASRGRKGAA